VNEASADSVALLRELVGFATISRESNRALIDRVAERLADAGARVRVRPGAVPGKSNLFASVGPEAEDGIVLSAHSDVVPVDGQSWSSDPFVLTERDEKLLARGAADMKGFLACALAAMVRAAHGGLRRPLHLALSHDEEIGCVGVRPMLATLAAEGFRAAGCVVGEPTGLAVATGHKGKVSGRILCLGEAGHSADPARGCNAINLAAAMVRETEALQARLAAEGARDESYAVPHSTVHVGTISGGTALNVIPDRCEMAFEMRLLPGDEAAALLALLRAAGERQVAPARARGRSASIEVAVENAYPGLAMPEGDDFVTRALGWAGGHRIGGLGFGAEAGLFREVLGLACVVCGPGEIERAHRADEYVTCSELAACDKFLSRVVASLSETRHPSL